MLRKTRANIFAYHKFASRFKSCLQLLSYHGYRLATHVARLTLEFCRVRDETIRQLLEYLTNSLYNTRAATIDQFSIQRLQAFEQRITVFILHKKC